jgi:hypothetical protein
MQTLIMLITGMIVINQINLLYYLELVYLCIKKQCHEKTVMSPVPGDMDEPASPGGRQHR